MWCVKCLVMPSAKDKTDLCANDTIPNVSTLHLRSCGILKSNRPYSSTLPLVLTIWDWNLQFWGISLYSDLYSCLIGFCYCFRYRSICYLVCIMAVCTLMPLCMVVLYALLYIRSCCYTASKLSTMYIIRFSKVEKKHRSFIFDPGIG